MSFDIYFFSRKENTLSKEKLVNYFSNISNIKMYDEDINSIQFGYENEDTSVYFTFDYSENSEEDEAFPAETDEYRNTGLSANINYLRPAFFAYEAFPVIVKTAEDLDLLILDPQLQNDGCDTPQKYSADDLILSWINNNDKAVKNFKNENVIHYSKEKLMMFWKYQKEKSSLQDKLGENYFVPNIFIVKKPDSKELIRLITWNQSIPQVIPECDFISILRKKKGLLGLMGKQEKGLIRYSDVIIKMGSLLEPFDGPISGIKILNPENYEKASVIFNDFELVKYNSLEGIFFDGSVVDAPCD